MALPSTGSITMSQVSGELGLTSTTQLGLNDSRVRALAGKTTGIIGMQDLRGKSSGTASVVMTNPRTESGSSSILYDYRALFTISSTPATEVTSVNFTFQNTSSLTTYTFTDSVALKTGVTFISNSFQKIQVKLGTMTTASGKGTQVLTIADIQDNEWQNEPTISLRAGGSINVGGVSVALPTTPFNVDRSTETW